MVYCGVFEDLQSKLLDYLLDVDSFDIANPISILETNHGLMWLILMHIMYDPLPNNRSHRLLLLFFFPMTLILIIHLLLLP